MRGESASAASMKGQNSGEMEGLHGRESDPGILSLDQRASVLGDGWTVIERRVG